mgnify:FL=1
MEKSIATCNIFNDNCLEKMKDIPDNSVDLIFNDLPYAQTSCKWDIAIDMDLYWKQVMRIKKLNTPIFFTTTTKFGVSLIQSAPKKCFFRYDLVWVKSAPAGFLSAKKMPMRKHEMIYVFYEKLPFYDLSSHKHKFIDKKHSVKVKKSTYGDLDIKQPLTSGARWSPALPVSVIKGVDNTYNTEGRKKPITREKGDKYDPPLPVSVVKELEEGQTLGDKGNECYGKFSYYNNGVKGYEPPLPVSVVKEEKYERKNSLYPNRSKNGETATSYEPPLPVSLLEIKSTRGKHSTEKPVALMEWVFKYYSKEGDTILDPTMGSGSTGIACKNMNRNFIGIEMDKDIFKVAEDRLKNNIS